MAKKQVYDYALGKFVDAAETTSQTYNPTYSNAGVRTATNTSTTKSTPTPTANKTSTTSSTAKAPEQTSAPATQAAAPATVSAPDYSVYQYDPATNAAYTSAMEALNKAKGEMPTYAGTYDDQLDELYNQIVNRDKFKYDLNEDMFYQQAADRAMQMGNMAMMDTMGQAAALTGGYGNTYAQNVGQQAYQGYIQQLNDNIPEYYQAAFDAYNAEGDAMLNQYGLLGDLANREYGQYQDELANYWQNVSHLQNVADTEYGRGYDNWYNAYQMGTNTQNTNYDRLVTMMTSMGYKPSEQEILAAGMTPEQAGAFMNYYDAQNKPKSYSGPKEEEFVAPTYDEILSTAKANIASGEKQYTDVYQVVDAAAKEGYITEAEKSTMLKDIYSAVKAKR